MATAGLISPRWKCTSKTLSDDHQAASDESLVTAAKRGDAAAFGELCERHSQKICRMAHRITRNREDAEDAVQECFLNAFIHLKSFDGRSRFSTWLVRIAMNAALMKLRKNHACREVPIEEPVSTSDLRPEHQVADSSPNPEERYANRERDAILKEAIAKLRPAIKKTVNIQLQGLSVDETAEILKISVPAVKGRLFHARAALRQTSRLQFARAAICTNSRPASHAVRQVFREAQGQKPKKRPYLALTAGIQARGVSRKEAQL